MCAHIVRMLLVCLAIGLASCSTETAPPPSPVAAPPAPPPPPQTTTRSAVGSWSFGEAGACTATITGSVASLDLAVGSDAVVYTARLRHDVSLPRSATVTMAYSGGSGAWSVRGTRTLRQPLIIRAAMNEEQASRILFLLDGGTIRFSEPAGQVSILRIPNAGPNGRAWFGCVRQKLAL